MPWASVSSAGSVSATLQKLVGCLEKKMQLCGRKVAALFNSIAHEDNIGINLTFLKKKKKTLLSDKNTPYRLAKI